MTEITFHQVEQDLITLYQRKFALEGFDKLMEGREVITGPTAVAMAIALEDANPEEAEDKGVTGKDIASGLKKIAITIRNIIQWLLRHIGALVEKLGLSMQRLGERGKKVKAAVAQLPEAAKAAMGKGDTTLPPETKLDLSALTVDGTFVGSDAEQLNNVIKMGDWINDTYPKMFDSIMTKVEELAKQHMSDDTSEGFFSGLAQVLNASTVLPPVPRSSENFAPSVAAGDQTINTVPMMGDRGLVMYNPKKASDINDNAPVDALRGYLTLELPEYTTKQQAPEGVPPADYETVVKLTDMVNKSIDKNNNGASDVKALMKRRIDSVNKIVAEMEAKGDKGPHTEIVAAVGLMLQRYGKLLTDVHEWYGRTLNQELGYLGLSIDVASQSVE